MFALQLTSMGSLCQRLGKRLCYRVDDGSAILAKRLPHALVASPMVSVAVQAFLGFDGHWIAFSVPYLSAVLACRADGLSTAALSMGVFVKTNGSANGPWFYAGVYSLWC